MAAPKLPKKVFVGWKDYEGDGTHSLVANMLPDELVDQNEIKTVGIYRLEKKIRVRNQTVIVGR